jgi:hypothetical protein
MLRWPHYRNTGSKESWPQSNSTWPFCHGNWTSPSSDAADGQHTIVPVITLTSMYSAQGHNGHCPLKAWHFLWHYIQALLPGITAKHYSQALQPSMTATRGGCRQETWALSSACQIVNEKPMKCVPPVHETKQSSCLSCDFIPIFIGVASCSLRM